MEAEDPFISQILAENPVEDPRGHVTHILALLFHFNVSFTSPNLTLVNKRCSEHTKPPFCGSCSACRPSDGCFLCVRTFGIYVDTETMDNYVCLVDNATFNYSINPYPISSDATWWQILIGLGIFSLILYSCFSKRGLGRFWQPTDDVEAHHHLYEHHDMVNEL